MNSVRGPTTFPASPRIAQKSPVCLALRGFLLPSLPTASQFKPNCLGVSGGISPNTPKIDTPNPMPKQIAPLTELHVRKAKPTEQPYRLADGKGLYLQVMPNGARYWRMKYRFDGKEK